MVEQAPYDYISKYYESVQAKNAAFPEIADFWQSGFRHVDGKRVLNLGCGPMFYDNLVHFGANPELYVGLDINHNSFEFLRNSNHPVLSENRQKAKDAGIEIQFIEGDAIEEFARYSEAFDCVIGVGFFGTFDGREFDALLKGTRNVLVSDGKLLKMTWHGAQRTEAETEEKLKYNYDNESEPSADDLRERIERVGFKTLRDDRKICPPGTIGWRSIQVAHFQKSAGVE